MLDANGQAGNGIGFGQTAEEAHGASVKRVTAEPLKGALVFDIDDEQRVPIGWSIIHTGACLDDARNAFQEFFDIFECAINYFTI